MIHPNKQPPPGTNLRNGINGMYNSTMSHFTSQESARLVTNRSTRDQQHTSAYNPGKTESPDPSTSTSPQGGGRVSVASNGGNQQDGNRTINVPDISHASPDYLANHARATETRKDDPPVKGTTASHHDSRGSSTNKKNTSKLRPPGTDRTAKQNQVPGTAKRLRNEVTTSWTTTAH